jgi:hypothetical protein
MVAGLQNLSSWFLAYLKRYHILGSLGTVKSEGSVPISAPGQNSRNEKNIRPSVIDRGKVILGKQEKQKSGKENRGESNASTGDKPSILMASS